jgi:hypothetical protein
MIVEPLRAAREREWDSYLRGSEAGLFVHSLAYRDLLIGELGCEAEYLVATDGGEVRGVMPLMWCGEGGNRVLNSLPYYGSHGGPVAADERAARALIGAWNERASDPGTLAATMVENPFAPEGAPEPLHGLTDHRIGQYTVLSGRGHEAMEWISSEARNNVRRAERRGVTVVVDNSAMTDVIRIHGATMAGLGAPPKSERFFEAIARTLRAGEDFDIWTARVGGRIAAALLVIRFNGVSEYFTSGTLAEFRWNNPHPALVVAALRHELETGARIWNWGGTRLGMDGVFHFKRKWGSLHRPYRYFVQVNDDSLLKATPAELYQRFPNFFVVPFAELLAAESV